MEILIQPALTVIGWILAAIWAVRQINITYEKNLELQERLLDEEHKKKIAEDLFEIYSKVSRALDVLKNKGSSLSINLYLEEGGLSPEIKISALTLVQPVNDSYNDFCEKIFSLRIWLNVYRDSLDNPSGLEHAIDKFNDQISAMNTKLAGHPWLKYQAALAVYQSGKGTNVADYVGKAWSEVNDALETIFSELTKATEANAKKLLKGQLPKTSR
jgi:hypothetical protein